MRFLIPLGIALFLAVTGFASDIAEATPETFFGNEENLQLVKAATAITVFRIVDSERHPDRKDLQATDGYKCGAKPFTVTGPEVANAIAALSDVRNFGVELMCDFDPGVILRIASGKRALDMVVCFHCGEMTLYRDGASIRRPYKFAQSISSLRRSSYRAFSAVAKKAFPKERDIQVLR